MKSTKRTFFLALLLVMSVMVRAQNLHVTGSVVSKENGEPIIGASVIEVGKATNGTITDLNGKFSLSVSKGATITISYIGYKSQEVKAGTNLKVELSEDSEMLDEVVVTGYTTQKKADLTGSVSVVSMNDLRNIPNSDPMRALQGRLPGVTISTDGSPSGVGTVRIRGIGSFNSSRDPLYIIDGVPTNQTLNSLNMNDIESMQVLKDAASASIYGSRAANGVIIITTKQGKKGQKINIDFSANLTAQFYTSQSTMDLCNTPEYATAMAQAALNDGLDPVAYAQNYGLNLKSKSGYPISVYDPKSGKNIDYIVNGYYDGYINRTKTMMFSNTDWLKAISRTGLSQMYDISFSQASEKQSSMLSIGYKKNTGILKYTDFENISARLNTVYHLNKVVSVGENFTVTYTNQVNLFPMENALKMAPTVPLYEKDGTTFGGPVGGMSDRQNPMRELYFNRDNRLSIWRLFGNGYVDIKPMKGLVLRSNFGLDYDAAFIHSYTYTFQSDIVKNDTPSTTLSSPKDMRWTWSNTANYNFTIAKNHTFNLLAGLELHKQNRVDMTASAEDFDVETPDYMWPDAATGVETATGTESGYSLFSLFGKVDYNWDDLVLSSFTIRRDGSSRFGAYNRYGVFPAATIGFRASKLMNKEWLDDFKIRLSWGETGNQAISNNARYSIFVADYGSDRVTSTAYDLRLQGSGRFPSGYRTIQAGNNNLKWETTIQYNIGVDFSLFNNGLYGTLDIYKKDIKDMLINPAYLATMGEGGSTWVNGPSLSNWGMEFTLGYRNKLPMGLEYNINTNADFYRSRVTYLPEQTTGSYAHTTKQDLVHAKVPYGSIVGYVVDGLYQSKEEVLKSGQDNARVGGLKYADLDGNGKIDADDQTWIFNPVPDFSYGVNIDLKYKDFDLTMFWQGVWGQDVYNDQKFQTDFWSLTDAGSNKGNRLLNAWTLGNTTSTIPALTTDNTGNEGRASTYFVENGSYLKLRTFQLGYNIPKSVLAKLKMNNVRVYVSGQNLLTIKSSSLTCSDPENPRWNYPLSTSVSCGLQVGF